MQFRLFKLRFRRRFHRGQKQVEELGVQAEASLERNFFKRFGSLGKVWRFISTWILLLLLLIGALAVELEGLSSHFQTVQPIPGGTYTEGLVGTFSNANPLYATSEVDSTVSHLLFAGLLTYNNQNKLVGALASSWEVNAVGTMYTVHLKPNLTWQDGKTLTADDVVFTYHAIQNPDAQSPLAAGWQGITVAKKDAYTITFTLPNPLSSFPYSLTNGIIPEHIFASLAVSDWRSADFNSVHPIGAGAFAWSALQVQNNGLGSNQVLIALKPFANFEGGRPKLDSFVVHVFSNQADLIKNFQKQQLSAITLQSPPAQLTKDKDIQQYDFIVSGATMAFFNNESPILSNVQVRQALIQGTDKAAIIRQLGFVTRAVHEPLLTGQLAYDPAYVQAGFSPVAARAALDNAGWVVGKDGVRMNAGKPLEISFYAGDSGEDRLVSRLVTKYWRSLGVKVDAHLQNTQDFQATVNNRSYDVLLDSIAIGVDPDVFVYWDSSQRDPRSAHLNLSNYKSATADAALEDGRTRLDPALRTLKYRPFLQAWQQDAPALALYQPPYTYLSNVKVYGLTAHTIDTGTDRLNNVQNWMIHTAKVTDN